MNAITMTPIGVVRSTRAAVSDDNWDREQAHVEIDTSVCSSDALRGIDSFSHVEVLFYMDRVDAKRIETAARHPRNNPNWPEVGILGG